MRHRVALKEKVKKILLTGDERRIGLVKRITVIPRPEALQSIVQILELVSLNLKSLKILAPAEHPFQADWRPHSYGTLDMRLCVAEISFGTVTHLHIGKGAIRYVEFLLHLLKCAPTLESLTANIEELSERPNWLNEGTVPDFETSIDQTQLRCLTLAMDDVNYDWIDGEIAVSIIEQSP